MKFNVIVGNPPYHIIQKGHYQPLYSKFIDFSQQVSSIFNLILPARFLFDTGKTIKSWNKKVLNNPHFKVLYFEADSTKIFSKDVEIKGGICIFYGNKDYVGKPIGVYIPYQPLRSIVKKVEQKDFQSLKCLYYSGNSYKITPQLYKDFPEKEYCFAKSKKYVLGTPAFERLGDIWKEQPPNDNNTYIGIYGRQNNKRAFKWIDSRYVKVPGNFPNYKVLIPKASGNGDFGERLGSPMIGEPFTGSTESFQALGNFKTEFEAQAALKYIKTKFVRVLVSVIKVTQDTAKKIWAYVPIQDFTRDSDINWTKSVSEIDQQLYRKYGLNEAEVTFIENNVKPMN